MSLPDKKTKIVCTIGPASESQDMLKRLIASGMNVARLNLAHGNLESHKRTIRNIRAASAVMDQSISIMADLPGPKIRIGKLAMESIQIERGQMYILQTEEIEGDEQRVSMSFSGLPRAVKPGDKIFINDGFIQLQVEKVSKTEIKCIVLVGGELRSYKGINLPGIDLGISAFTIRDRELLKFACEQKLDAISQSFVEGPDDIQAVRSSATKMGYEPFIIAKIERTRAVDNLEKILETADGIMVARGDLGVEIPIEKIALTQKHIINRANLQAKPVITATHMLEFMVYNLRPTRAEATDVANAIIDGTDCVMLSGETATGNYPAEAVAIMTRIARVTEPSCGRHDVAKVLEQAKTKGKISREDLISLTIYFSVEAVEPSAIMVPTLSGSTARLISRYRLPAWIIAVSPDKSTCRNLQFSYGVYPVYEQTRPANWEEYTRTQLLKHSMMNGMAILTQGSGSGHTGGTNQIEIINLDRPADEVSIW